VLWIVNGGDDQEYADHRLQRPRTATRSSHPRSEAARPYHPAERGGACCQSHWATTIGLVAGCLSSWSLVPQLLKCWRDGLTEAVSKKMFATRAFGLVLWVVYGFFGGSPPVMIFGSVNLVLSITILALTLRNSSRPEAHIVRRERPYAIGGQPLRGFASHERR
jgi:MtN3 and saliva related transmembrane protein